MNLATIHFPATAVDVFRAASVRACAWLLNRHVDACLGFKPEASRTVLYAWQVAGLLALKAYWTLTQQG